jgi:hypothetical protein
MPIMSRVVAIGREMNGWEMFTESRHNFVQ